MDLNDIIAGVAKNPALAETIGNLGIDPAMAQAALGGVLSQLSQGQDVSKIAASVAESSGLDVSQILALLPGVVAALQGHAGGAGGDIVTGLLSKLQGGQFGDVLAMLDTNKDGSVVDDALNLVKGLFSRNA
jgi:hypothetical protein